MDTQGMGMKKEFNFRGVLQSMTYGKGDYKISVEHIKEFGKNPGLWVHKGNEAFKMASFGSFEKAELFCAYIEYFLFDTPIPDMVHEGDKVRVNCN